VTTVSSDEEEPGFFSAGKNKQPIHEEYKETVFEANEDSVLNDAVYVYDYVNKVLGIEEKNIILFGRSMGTGPATHIASVRSPGCVLLMSGYKSIRAIAHD